MLIALSSNAPAHRTRAGDPGSATETLLRGSVQPARSTFWSWKLVPLNQSVQAVKIGLLCRNAPSVKLARHISVRSVLNNEISTAGAVIVRPDENITRPGICEDGLLELLSGHDDSVCVQMCLKLRPRSRVVTAKRILQ
jgi:hypothetical protein